MTREEAIICKIYLEDLDKHHTCNEYKLLMGLLEQEPCEDAISRQAAIYACKNGWNKGFDEIMEDIKQLPPVKPAEKVGHWITVDKGLKVTSYKCSECGRIVRDDTGYDVIKDYPYCHCGAKMQEVKE